MIILLTFYEILKNDGKTFEFLFEIPKAYNPSLYIYKIAIPSDGYFEINYEVLEFSKLNSNDILNVANEKVFEIQKKKSIDVDYIELKINPYYKVNNELYVRNKIKFKINFFIMIFKQIKITIQTIENL
jgi:hypothetical protein